ncbi:unnamed protein product [Taenia asiatica]|uniref:Uncharacterized protein n=1 Tax=Taenia asiatica TaxID=60517 RepID=A0A0R3WHF9_TAEAS|nr:unnamed protein product [Taenia asiatica]
MQLLLPNDGHAHHPTFIFNASTSPILTHLHSNADYPTLLMPFPHLLLKYTVDASTVHSFRTASRFAFPTLRLSIPTLTVHRGFRHLVHKPLRCHSSTH